MSGAVTVVIPTRAERPQLLAEALASVVGQRYDGHIHAVVVLDSDKDPGLLPSGAPGRSVAVVRNTATAGAAGARNFGLSLTETDWIATLDDDDVWHPEKTRRQVQFAERHPQAPVVGCGIAVQAEDGRVLARHARADRISHDDLLNNRTIELHHSALLMRTGVLRMMGGWDESLPGSYGEDWDLLLRLARRGDLVLVADPLVTIRWTGDSYFFSRWGTISVALRAMLDKHDFASSRLGHARILGQLAFADAAAGSRRSAAAHALHALLRNPLEPRAYLALGVASRAVSPERVQAALHRRGRGI